MPEHIVKFVPYDVVQRDTLRLFPGDSYGTPSAFVGQMNHCAMAFWTVR